jgi:hypothetical protein
MTSLRRPVLLAAALAAAAVAVPVSSPSAAQALPLCVQYVDPLHMGSYQVCPLGGSSSTAPAPVAAPKVPTSVCDVAELVGVTYVKDCEGVIV